MDVLRRIRLALFCLWLVASGGAAAAAPTEYQVKAVFLFNFTQFVDWPQDAFANAQAPIVIGVLGDDPFGAALDEVVRGETVQGRTLAVRRYRSVEEIDVCHILFINSPAQQGLEDILRRLRERNVLTVGDSADFARAGGVIQFVTIDSKIRLQINLDAAKLANLTISSKLLRPARIVTTG